MNLTLLLSLSAICLSVGALATVWLLLNRLKASNTQMDAQQALIAQLQKQTKQVHNELHEMRSGNYALNSRVKSLVKEVENLQVAHQKLSEQDPQARFYSNAAKLISQGASLEEVMQECGLPAAEAELLFNLHNTAR